MEGSSWSLSESVGVPDTPTDVNYGNILSKGKLTTVLSFPSLSSLNDSVLLLASVRFSLTAQESLMHVCRSASIQSPTRPVPSRAGLALGLVHTKCRSTAGA